MGVFVPQYILNTELAQYGLPDVGTQPDIINLIQLASVAIDEACGRIDGDGNGSLVYTTYTSRILLQTRNRNLIYLPQKPIVGVSAATVANLQALGSSGTNIYYTGVQASTVTTQLTGQLSGIISASGRYGYTRQDRMVGYPDLYSVINPLSLLTLFGGPAPWVQIDISLIDYDLRSGEAWVPAGLQLQTYAEVLISWSAGYNPLAMPNPIKLATAALVKNAMARGDGTTGLMSMTIAKSGANFSWAANLIDETVDALLTPFRSVRAY